MSISSCTLCASPAEKYAQLVRERPNKPEQTGDKDNAEKSALLNFNSLLDIKI
ncbi:MAG: hypothetical protein V4691_00450 [Pseudomonadota bacterium]